MGRKPVLDALDSDMQIEKVLIERELTGEIEIKIRKLCRERSIPLQRIPRQVLDKASSANHQGVMCFVSLIEYQSFDELVDDLIFRKGEPVFVFLDQVKDVRNLGAIARSAEVLGASALVIPENSSAAINDFAIKASAGALLKLPISRVPSLQTALKTIRLHGVRIVATSMKDGNPIHKEDFSGPIALLMGSEEKGIRPHLQRTADTTVSIPQIGTTDSLNVSVATGVILYEIARQRGFPVNPE